MKDGQYVLENKMGQVVRTFRWQRPPLYVVRHPETGRIETAMTLKEIEKEHLEIVAKLNSRSLKEHPLELEGGARIRWIPEVKCTTPEVLVPEDQLTEFKQILKWTAGIYLGALCLIFIIGHFLRPKLSEAATQKVTIVPRSELQQIHPQTVVAPARNREELARHQTHYVSHKRFFHPRHMRVVKRYHREENHLAYARRTRAIHHWRGRGRGHYEGPSWGRRVGTMGALGVLGSSHARGTGRGGFNVANARSTGGYGRGRGGGGLGGSGHGGIPRAIFSEGLVAANPGRGSGAPGAGGYGVAGFGGGGRRGYGHLSMIRASHAYFEPASDADEEVRGGLDKAQINSVVQRHKGEVAYCYEQGLQRSPSLRGRVPIHFVIGGAGRVVAARVLHSTLGSRQVEGCILRHLRSWAFPHPVGGVSVRVFYPFFLHPVSG